MLKLIVPPGKHFMGGKRLFPGDEIEVSEREAEALKKYGWKEAAEHEEEEEEEEEDEMSTKVKAAEARAKAAEAALATYKREQKAKIIEQARERVTPNLLASVEAFAESVGDDFERLQEFVAALPIATHATPTGATVQAGTPTLSAEQVKFAKRIGLTPEEFARGLEEK